jgi:N-acylglucosamine-6-phosphate 2-epimerase
LELVRLLAAQIRVPVVAEGRIWSPAEAILALEAGAEYVVVGGAITRPQQITAKYSGQIEDWLGEQ